MRIAGLDVGRVWIGFDMARSSRSLEELLVELASKLEVAGTGEVAGARGMAGTEGVAGTRGVADMKDGKGTWGVAGTMEDTCTFSLSCTRGFLISLNAWRTSIHSIEQISGIPMGSKKTNEGTFAAKKKSKDNLCGRGKREFLFRHPPLLDARSESQTFLSLKKAT